MAAERLNHPTTHTLSGKSYSCYRAGHDIGTSQVYSLMAEHLDNIKRAQEAQLKKAADLARENVDPDSQLYEELGNLPQLADYLGQAADQCRTAARETQQSGSRTLAEVAHMEDVATARWSPPFRAILLLTGVMAAATTIATLTALFALGHGW